jgi:NDP-sugar pyrophosphorylase family protein
MTLPVAILAGGLGSRLHPLTERTPKALVPVAGRPFVFHQLELLRGQGVRRVVLCVGYLGEQIQAAVGGGSRFGLDVQYSLDGERLLGTGGALRRALPLLGAEFFVLYGDTYLPCPFAAVQDAYLRAGQPALMTVLRNEDRWGRSNVALRNGMVEYEKNSRRRDLEYIDFGLSVMGAQVLSPYSQAETLDLAMVWRDLSVKGQLAAFEVTERFYEIGSREGMAEAESFLARRAVAG